MPSTERSVVIGFVANLPADQVRPFFDSLRATDYVGRTCLFVAKTTPGAIEELKTLADEVIAIDAKHENNSTVFLRALVPLLRWMRKTPKVRRLYPAAFKVALGGKSAAPRRFQFLEYALEGLQSLRYAHYLRYLTNGDFDQVMITDVRDVMFQRDPFLGTVQELEVVLEDSSVLLGRELFNRRWLLDLYGHSVVQSIGQHVVSCSGTTRGTTAGMVRYLNVMVEEISKHLRPLGSHDQGVHNYLLRTGKLNPVTIYENENGPIITLGQQKTIDVNDNNQVINRDKSVAAVVHQYDRHLWLTELIHSRSGDASAS